MEHLISATHVVETARSWVGTPYAHQASLKGIGCDCLGLLRGVWRELHGTEPREIPNYSSVWSEVSHDEQLMEAASDCMHKMELHLREPGDVIVFRMRANSVAKHVGILATPQRFFHAYEGTCVSESSLCDFWRRRIAGVFRFPFVDAEDNF